MSCSGQVTVIVDDDGVNDWKRITDNIFIYTGIVTKCC